MHFTEQRESVNHAADRPARGGCTSNVPALLKARDGEVLPPASAIEKAAERLHGELERMFPSNEGCWHDLSEGHRQAILEIVEHLLQSWPLLVQAHDEMLK